MFGEEGQRKIETERVGVVGGGRLGSPMGQALAYAGVLNYGVIDDDVLDETNMKPGAGGFSSDVGRLKVEVVREHILKIIPEAKVKAIPIAISGRGSN